MKPTKGLYLDCLPEDQPEGTYRNARNILLGKLNNAVSNEDGLEKVAELPVTPVYVLAVDNDEYVVWGTYTSQEDVLHSQIGRLKSDGTYTPVLTSAGFRFKESSSFKAIYLRNSKGELVVAWTNDLEAPRILNLDDVPFTGLTGTEKLLADNNLLVLTELFPRFKAPLVDFDLHTDSGGQLLSGAYYFTFAYETEDGGRTNFGNLVGPFMVTDDVTSRGPDLYDGCEPGTATSKCIEVNLSYLDTRYKHLRVAVIHKQNSVLKASYVGKFPVTSSNGRFLYTGGEVHAPLLVEEVLADNPTYKTAKTLTMLDNRLYLANLSQEPRVDFQSFASEIKIDWVTDKVNLDQVRGSYKDEITIFNKRGFMPDEVYALYATLLFDDGSKSEAFHIPGREAQTIDYTAEGTTVSIAEDARIEDILTAHPTLVNLKDDLTIDGNIKFFHTRETAKADGTMGFWENETELYPEGFGALTGKRVRHHKFPGLPMLQSSWTSTEDPGGVISHAESKDMENLQSTAPLSAAATLYGFILKTVVLKAGDTVEFKLSGGGYGTNVQEDHTSNLDLFIDGAIVKEGSLVMDSVVDKYHPDGSYFQAEGAYTFSGTLTKATFSGGIYTATADHSLTINGNFDLRILASKMETPTEVDCYAELYLDIIKTAVVAPEEEGKFYTVLGIKVSNIQIPQEIRNRVIGIQIMYAKRNFSSMRVLGMAPLFFYQSPHAINAGKLGPSIGSRAVTSGSLDFTKGRFHAFDLLKDKPSAAPTHLKVGMLLESIISVQQTSTEQDDLNDDTTVTQSTLYSDLITNASELLPANLESKMLRSVADYTYIPGDTTMTLQGVALDNTWGEEHAFFTINHANGSSGWAPSNGLYTPTGGVSSWKEELYLTSLFQHRKNAYASFMEQEMVTLNKILSPVATQATLFGGDTHLNRYAIRLTAPLFVSSSHKSTNKFQAIKATYYFPVYSVHNIDLRHEGKELKDSYYPKVGSFQSDTYEKWVKRAADSPNSNSYFYNTDYTSVNDLDKAYPFNPFTDYLEKFPFRIVRSKVHNPEESENSIRTFLPLDYYEIGKQRGEITNVEAYGEVLFINTKASVFRTVGNETLKATTTEIALGSGDIFRMPPKELITSEGGYAGCQHISSCFVSKLGYFFVDAEQSKVFLVSNDLKEISNNGMRTWFQKYCNHSEVPDIHDMPNDITKGGFTVAYDEKYNRLIFAIVGADNLHTLSFSSSTDTWISMHDYYPGFLRNTRRSLISVHNRDVYLHNIPGYPGKFHGGVTYPSFIEAVFNQYPDTSKVFASLTWRTQVQTHDGKPKALETFSDVLVWDSRHCSGGVKLDYLANVRNAEGEWRFNAFRNLVKDSSLPFMDEEGEVIPSNLDPEKPWYEQGKFIDNYLIVRLIEDNVRKNTLYLYSVDANYRVSDR